MLQPPRLAVLGTPEALAASSPARLEPLLVELTPDGHAADAREQVESADIDAAIVLCADAEAFEPLAGMAVPAIAWSATGGRPQLGTLDRWVSACPAAGAWRHLPLPVADELYCDGAAGAGRPYWLGGPSERRSELLSHCPRLAAAGADGDVAVNLRDAEPATLEHRAATALAAGRVLVSETLALGRGLEPGLDYLEVRELDELCTAVETVSRRPLAFERMRLRGRAKAAAFEASGLLARTAVDLLLDLDRP